MRYYARARSLHTQQRERLFDDVREMFLAEYGVTAERVERASCVDGIWLSAVAHVRVVSEWESVGDVSGVSIVESVGYTTFRVPIWRCQHTPNSCGKHVCGYEHATYDPEAVECSHKHVCSYIHPSRVIKQPGKGGRAPKNCTICWVYAETGRPCRYGSIDRHWEQKLRPDPEASECIATMNHNRLRCSETVNDFLQRHGAEDLHPSELR